MPLPTASHVLPLARKRKLVLELAEALAYAEDREDLPLVRILEKAVRLGRKLEQAVGKIQGLDPPPESPDHLLQGMLAVSLELGQLLRRARESG